MNDTAQSYHIHTNSTELVCNINGKTLIPEKYQSNNMRRLKILAKKTSVGNKFL